MVKQLVLEPLSDVMLRCVSYLALRLRRSGNVVSRLKLSVSDWDGLKSLKQDIHCLVQVPAPDRLPATFHDEVSCQPIIRELPSGRYVSC